MKSKVILAFTVLLFLAQGCIPSLHPLYTKDKIVYLRLLEGVWADQPGDIQVTKKETVLGKEKDVTVTINEDLSGQHAIWDFRKKGESGYLLIHQDNKGRKAAFDVFVVKLGDDYFMDFFLTDLPEADRKVDGISTILDSGPNDLAAFHILPVHTFAKLIVINDEVKIKMFDPDFLEKLFKHRQIRIKHEQLGDGGILLTAQPEELQKFVEKYASHNEAFIDDVIVLNKQS